MLILVLILNVISSLASTLKIMPIYSSDSDNEMSNASSRKLFGRERPLHNIFGGGKVADVLLWRNKNVSASILFGFTLIWFLFEVVEYNFVSLSCHLAMIAMLVLFIWTNGAGFINRSPPKVHDIELPESFIRTFFAKVNWFLLSFYDIARGKDLPLFVLAIFSLWILSIIGNYFSTLNLLYLAFLCLETIPVLYDRYENQVETIASKGNRDVKKLYKKFDSKVLNKIPRGPVKEHKRK